MADKDLMNTKELLQNEGPDAAGVSEPESAEAAGQKIFDQGTLKRANRYFFSKVAINVFLMILGAVLIAFFLRKMQADTALYKQQDSSRQALEEAVTILKENEENAKELTQVFHKGNQDVLEDMEELFSSGLFDSLAYADTATRSSVFADVVERSGVQYLFLMSMDSRIVLAPQEALYGINPSAMGLMTQENINEILKGTLKEDGTVAPVLIRNQYGSYYFYSMSYLYNGSEYVLALGTDTSVLDVQISSLKDVSVVLSRAAVSKSGFLFAVSKEDNTFLYYRNGSDVLTGQNALDAGLSEAALNDGYSGTEMIKGVSYYCVSKAYGDQTIVCAVAQTDEIIQSDKYVLFWSILGFVLVMVLCLAYAVVVRNDFVKHAVVTKKVVLRADSDNPVYFDKSVFKKVFPLMLAGVMLMYGLSFYTQTLLEITEGIEKSKVALEEVSTRYNESIENRELIRAYYNERFLSMARLISFLIEEDPSVLNEASDYHHSIYDEDGNKHYLTDDEGNRLKSVSRSSRLQELCDENDIDCIYLFDENGHTIATNTGNWFFTISTNKEDQSYPFRDVLDAKKDHLVQEAMTDDFGETNQYIGVPFRYYTTTDDAGNTVYASHYDYELSHDKTMQQVLASRQGAAAETEAAEENGNSQPAENAEAAAGENETPQPAETTAAGVIAAANRRITPHRSLLQIGLDEEVTSKLMDSTDVGSILSTNMLSGGFIVMFDTSDEHKCVYSPKETSIGKTADELGISPNAFKGNDYYGFSWVNGTEYFIYSRYAEGYYIATALPKSMMYQTRGIIALVTAIMCFVLILILSCTVTFTNREEEKLYGAISEAEAVKGFNSAIFNVILPSGSSVATTKAAARWDNRRIPWSEKSPEQKLITMISIVFGILILYIVLSVIGVDTFYDENSIIHYILGNTWDRGRNIFAFSACTIILVATAIAVALFRIPVRIMTSLLGARGETIGHLLLSVAKYGGAIGAFFFCLYLIGINSSSLLASAGILSLVVGLGAQSLIKDIIAGIFIVFEGEFRVGDIVTINDYRGTVMDIGLRTTKILGADDETGGNIKIYNNSDISGILNMTQQVSVAICQIDIEYGQDIEYVEAVLNKEFPAIKAANPMVLEGPTYLGVSGLGESGVSLKIICKCSEQDIKKVTRYLNKSILQIFYKYDINVPFPNVTYSVLDTDNRKTMEDLMKGKKAGDAK